MASSRKDSKGYVLRPGESQRQDGRYAYSYTDRRGKRHYVYAKSLVELRKKEQQINKDIYDGIDPLAAERITVNQIYDRYMEDKYDLKETTRTNYLYVYDHFIRETFGMRKVASVRYSDVKKFYYDIILEKKMKACTLESVHTQLHPAFQMAVRDGLIRINPTDGVMAEIKKSHVWDKKKRMSLTIPQQRTFMKYLYESRDFLGWKPVITVLLGTGMRIGECLGLRWDDVDLENRTINVNHSLVHRKIRGDISGKIKHINTPKTEAGNRIIPMLPEVYDALIEEYQIQSITGYCKEVVDGYENFIFSTSEGTVTIPSEVNNAIDRIIEAYNNEERAKAKKEKREPFLLPHFSAHHLRHTFCTRVCENETNVKAVQAIMGHANVTTTLDVYADVTEEKKKEVIAHLENKVIIV